MAKQSHAPDGGGQGANFAAVAVSIVAAIWWGYSLYVIYDVFTQH